MFSQVPVYRYWPVKDQAEGTRVLLTFSDGAPALIEREFKGPKTGRVLLWTTPLGARSRRWETPAAADSRSWNELPMTSTGWAFLVLMNDTVPYLANAAGDKLDWEAGDNVLLKLDPTARFTNFSVTGPDQKTRPGVVPSPSSDFLAIDRPQEIGPWTVKAIAADKSERTLGFSVNAPEKESEFTIADKSQLDTIFGKDGYKLAEDEQSLKGQAEDCAARPRDLSVAHVPDPDGGDAREFPGQHVLQGSPPGTMPALGLQARSKASS